MPQATNITVKNASNVDKTFTLLTPAAGDQGVAQWALKEGASMITFPQLSVVTQRKPSSRSIRVKFFVPVISTDTITGVDSVRNRAEANLSLAIPLDFPESNKDDLVAYLTNLLSSSLMKSALRDALPLT